MLLLQIAERKRSETLLSKVLENMPVGVWITDKVGQIVHGNLESQQIWAGMRYVGTEQYGEYKGWWVDTGELIQPEEWAAFRAINRGETSLNEEVEIETFDGVRKIILNSATPILDEQKAVQGVIIVNQDITSRKQHEQQLIQTNELGGYFSASTRSSLIWIKISTSSVNDAYANSAGHPADFCRQEPFDLYHEENQAFSSKW
jgi:PAS domain-containing protein